MITTNNYQEYFLLYIDNELNKADRLEVENFISLHPDLSEELEAFKQMKLSNEMDEMNFPEKESLLHPVETAFINAENYGSWFLLYTDNELSGAERTAVEKFAAGSPHYQSALNDLLRSRLQPDTEIKFLNKEKLLHREVATTGMYISLKRTFAVAAILLLALGIFFYIKNQQSVSNKPQVAVIKHPALTNKENIVASTNKGNVNKVPDQQLSEVRVKSKELANKSTRKLKQNDSQKDLITSLNVNENKLAVEPEIKPSGILAIGNNNRIENVNTTFHDPGKTNLAITDQLTAKAKSDQNILAADNNNEDIAIGPVSTKNKWRGILRRVSRTFEKNTHLPINQRRSLLIGNLEIAIK